MIPADDITSAYEAVHVHTSADEAATVESAHHGAPYSSEAVRRGEHPALEGPAVCAARSRCSSPVGEMRSPRPVVDEAPHAAPPTRPSAEPLPSSRQLQLPPSAPCAVGVPIPPSAGRPRSLRRSTGMLRLYTSPRTPADSTRQVRRGERSGGEASYPLACAPCANGAAAALPSGVATRSAWVQPIISPGHSLFNLQGHTLKPTREGLVPVAAAPAAGAGVETAAAWSRESIWLENGSSLPTSVTVRQQAAKELAPPTTAPSRGVGEPTTAPNGSDAVRPPTPGRPTLA